MLFGEILKAILYGVVEGITEWLPISSTGHLILVEELVSFSFSQDAEFMAEFWEMFEVVIQLGAILAAVILFWNKLWPFGSNKPAYRKKQTWILWGKVVVGCIPAGVVGVIGDKLLEKATGKDIDGWLYNCFVVAAALILYGIAFILIEKYKPHRVCLVRDVYDISWSTAFKIGCFQTLSIVPGTSRSGSTILGSLLCGVSRPDAAEFSFFLAIPVMAGASFIKALGFAKYIWESQVTIPAEAWIVLLVASAVSFIVSMVAIRFLMNFVKKYTFTAFGWYRICLGILVLIWFAVRG